MLPINKGLSVVRDLQGHRGTYKRPIRTSDQKCEHFATAILRYLICDLLVYIAFETLFSLGNSHSFAVRKSDEYLET